MYDSDGVTLIGTIPAAPQPCECTSDVPAPKPQQQQQQQEKEEDAGEFDTIIIGAGPAALTVLSALHEPLSGDEVGDHDYTQEAIHSSRHGRGKTAPRQRIAVVDPAGAWMTSWNNLFANLQIHHLRSPSSANPDMAESNRLTALARYSASSSAHDAQGLSASSSFVPIELPKYMQNMAESATDAFHLPTQKAFQQHCIAVSERYSSSVTMVKGWAEAVVVAAEGADDGSPKFSSRKSRYAVRVASSSEKGKKIKVHADRVVLAIGQMPRPRVPSPLLALFPSLHDASRIVHTNDFAHDNTALTRLVESREREQPSSTYLVVGGGTSAAHAALALVNNLSACNATESRVVLVMPRRCLVRQFDVPFSWLDRRRVRTLRSRFYNRPLEERMRYVRDARGGGTIPREYYDRLIAHPRITVLEAATIADARLLPEGNKMRVTIACGDHESSPSPAGSTLTLVETVSQIVLATGNKVDCSQTPLIQEMLKSLPCRLVDGLPELTDNLRWHAGHDIFVTGVLATLRIGPDAGNLMGIRQAARIIANEAGLFDDLLVNQNRYALLAVEGESSDEDEDEDEEDADSDCVSDSSSDDCCECSSSYSSSDDADDVDDA